MRGGTIVTDITIDAPIDHVWHVLTDLDAYSRWNPYLVHVEPAGPGYIRVRQRIDGRAQDIVQTAQIVRLEPWSMHWRGIIGDPPDLEGNHFFELSPVGALQTELHHWEEFTGPRASEFLEWFGDTVHQNFDRFNAALKRATEAGA